jgi:tRNA1Val (adenine37-N6)-methyltransferase
MNNLPQKPSPAPARVCSAVVQRETTEDALLDGKLRLRQPADGYRVNVDALLLAAFAAAGPVAKLAVDLGAGVGSVGLVLHSVGAALRLTLVEREADLVELARENLERAKAPGEVVRLDLGTDRLPVSLRERADLVVSNPPFFTDGSARRQKHPQTARARLGSLEPFVVAAARALRGTRGRAAFAYPARSMSELFAAATQAGLVPKRLRLVHARPGDPARLALVELRRARPGGLVVEPPLFEWAGARARSEELADIVAGRFGRARRS